MVIRFVDVAKNNSEGFVGYHLCKERTAEVIKQIIIDALLEVELSMSYCCGQSYDVTGDIV